MRDIKKIVCVCGGEVDEVSTTQEEIDKYGCYRDKPDPWDSCCVTAYACNKCGARFVISFASPDVC